MNPWPRRGPVLVLVLGLGLGDVAPVPSEFVGTEGVEPSLEAV